MQMLKEAVRPEITTWELDQLAETEIRKAGAEPAFLGYQDRSGLIFPATLCTSINEELVHCLPSKNRKLQTGDIISLDLGVRYQGYITDMATTVAVGTLSPVATRLLTCTAKALEGALAIIRPGITLGDLGHKIQGYAQVEGFSVIRDLVGHGVGRSVHEEPQIPNFGAPGQGSILKTGMVLAIEPMFAKKSSRVKFSKNGWCVKMADGGLCAHFEKTIAVISKSVEILTK